MISAPNYVDVYISCQLSNKLPIKDKLYERKIEASLLQQWERGNGESQQTYVPWNPPARANSPPPTPKRTDCQDGCLSSSAAGLDPVHAARHHFSKKCVFRSWHNFSSSLPVLLATSLSVSTFHLSVIFSNVGHWEDSAVWPIFQIPVSLQEQYLLLRMNFVGAGYVGLLPTGLSCWQPRMALFLGLSSHASGPLKHSGMNPRKTLYSNRAINTDCQV